MTSKPSDTEGVHFGDLGQMLAQARVLADSTGKPAYAFQYISNQKAFWHAKDHLPPYAEVAYIMYPAWHRPEGAKPVLKSFTWNEPNMTLERVVSTAISMGCWIAAMRNDDTVYVELDPYIALSAINQGVVPNLPAVCWRMIGKPTEEMRYPDMQVPATAQTGEK